MAGVIFAAGPNIRQTRDCMLIRLCAVYYIACTPSMLALVYCNFLTEVRLGSWGTMGPKASTLCQYVKVRAPPFR